MKLLLTPEPLPLPLPVAEGKYEGDDSADSNVWYDRFPEFTEDLDTLSCGVNSPSESLDGRI